MEGRKQFTFYRSYREAVRKLSAKRRLGILEAVIAYGLDGTEPVGLDDVEEAIFTVIRPTLDASRKKALGGMKSKIRERSQKDTDHKKETENEIKNEIENEFKNEIETETKWSAGAQEEVVGFEDFWKAFPVKVGKEAARKAWEETDPEPQAVLDGLQRWKRSIQWGRENGRFVPRAAKFLLEKQYLDSPPQAIPKGASGELGQAELEAIAQILKEE